MAEPVPRAPIERPKDLRANARLSLAPGSTRVLELTKPLKKFGIRLQESGLVGSVNPGELLGQCRVSLAMVLELEGQEDLHTLKNLGKALLVTLLTGGLAMIAGVVPDAEYEYRSTASFEVQRWDEENRSYVGIGRAFGHAHPFRPDAMKQLGISVRQDSIDGALSSAFEKMFSDAAWFLPPDEVCAEG